MNAAGDIAGRALPRFRFLPNALQALFVRPAFSGRVKRGYATGLFWTISDSERADVVEGVADHYQRDMLVLAGALDADENSLLLGLGHSGDVAAGDRPLALCVGFAHPGSWIAAWQLDDGTWWTSVYKDGQLLPGPATDRHHADRAAATAAIATELREARENNETVDAIYGSPGIAADGVPFHAESVDETLRLALDARKRATGRGGRRTSWPRLRRSKASEHLRRRIAIWAGAIAAAALLWWAIAALISRADVRNAVAPPPPPPPPPPWIVPVQRLPAPVWASSCLRKTEALEREIAGWKLAGRECTENSASVRWDRVGASYPFGTVASFEAAFAGTDPRAGLLVEFQRQGNAASAALPMATPAERASAPTLEPLFNSYAIERTLLRTGQQNATRVETRPRQQHAARPNDKRPYFFVRFTSELPVGATPVDWARVFDVPGLSIKTARWDAHTLQWSIEGEVFERN